MLQLGSNFGSFSRVIAGSTASADLKQSHFGAVSNLLMVWYKPRKVNLAHFTEQTVYIEKAAFGTAYLGRFNLQLHH